jgi:hypothetical protein
MDSSRNLYFTCLNACYESNIKNNRANGLVTEFIPKYSLHPITHILVLITSYKDVDDKAILERMQFKFIFWIIHKHGNVFNFASRMWYWQFFLVARSHRQKKSIDQWVVLEKDNAWNDKVMDGATMNN